MIRRTILLANRRQFLGAIGMGAASVLLAACGGAPAAPAATAPPANATAPSAPTPTSAPAPSTAPAATVAPAATTAPTVAATTAAASTTATPAASSAPAGQGKPGGQITIAWSRYPISFNAVNPVGGIERTVHQLTTSRLINYDVSKKIVPDLAETWEISSDGQTYTFHLAKNAKWSDGQPVTAKDVEFTYTLAADKKSGSSVTIAMQAVKGAKEYQDGSAKTVAGIKVVDDNTIQFQLAGPDATFTAFLAGYYGPYIVPYHILKDVPPDQFDKSDYNTKIPWVGMGPYLVSAGQKDQFMEFARNDNYFKGKPLIDKFVYRVMQPDVALAALQKGEIDLMGQGSGFPAKEAGNVRANPKLKLTTYPSFLYNALEVNMTKDYLKDPRIHQAILYALDRKTFVDKVLGGLGEVWDGIIVQPDWVSPNLIKYDYNPDKAKQLLKDANWDSNRVVEWRYYGGFSDYAPFVQQSLANVGFKINPVSMETATWVKEVVTNGNFEMSVVGGGGITDDPNELYDYFVCDHWSRYCNQQVLDLFDQGRKTVDKAARQKIYFQIEEIINKDAPWMVINASTSAAAFGARVHPVAYSNYDYLSYHQWWLDQ